MTRPYSRPRPEQAFVDHGCGTGAERAFRRPVELSQRERRIGLEATRGEFADELLLGQKALWLTGELREHEGLAGQRFGLFGKRAAREREQKQCTSGSRHARGLSNRLPELTARTREVPDPVRDDEVEDRRREGQLVHRRPQQAHTIRELSIRTTRAAAAVSIGNERSVPTTSQPAWASGNALRPAPHPMSSNRADARHSRAATWSKVSFGDDRTKPATVSGWLQGESLDRAAITWRSSVVSNSPHVRV